ncbi:MAG TPA: tRNA isopentenyl-2-thiomethyl-A-37 hydroxylase MiaE [Gammaproteobacteria bacterium]|nr:tRNA isopentenyl-2-thiomethyl-A-37 hydroxylase MiaE [Gammaproteobacteria bacterium]
MRTDALAAGHLLACPTPRAWLDAAPRQQDLLLLDHANCEKKAAATAFSLMFQYGDRYPDLQEPLSRLAREELRHFEQVTRLLRRRGIPTRPLGAARYAAGLRRHARKHEPGRLADLLLVGAFIEARSCERFTALSTVLDAELADFYASLAGAEARHFSLYLALAQRYAGADLGMRLAAFAETERELIEAPDREFRFHSGIPAGIA